MYLLYKGVSLWRLHTYTQYTSIKLMPPSLLTPLPPSWNKFNRFHCSVFMHVYRILWTYSTPTLASCPPLPFAPTPAQKPVLHSCHLFLRTRSHMWERTLPVWFISLDMMLSSSICKSHNLVLLYDFISMSGQSQKSYEMSRTNTDHRFHGGTN